MKQAEIENGIAGCVTYFIVPNLIRLSKNSKVKSKIRQKILPHF
jgi:hypothetical protein